MAPGDRGLRVFVINQICQRTGTRRALTFESVDYNFLERFAIRLTLTGPRGFSYVVRYVA